MEPKESVELSVEVTLDASTTLPSDCMNNNSRLIGSISKPFVSVVLANFHAGYFRISMSLSAQVMLWNNLTQFTKENNDRHMRLIVHMLPSIACTLFWFLALVVLLSLSLVYLLRCYYHSNKVRAEFLNHVGVNYLFAPWMSCLFLLQSPPNFIEPWDRIYRQTLWWVFVVPIIMLDIKIYGQWFTKGKRFLSRVANPTSQLSVIANLVGAKAAIYMGWMEIAMCLFSFGMVHYLVLFVTLYQRLPMSDGVSTMLRPVFFLFIATPSMASLAWSSITGSFGNASKMLFFLSLFLFISLICRPSLFKKSMKKFRIAWWAYSFPLTLLALTSVEYSQAVKEEFAQTIAILLSAVSILVSFVLMILSSVKFTSYFLPMNLTNHKLGN